ncbi:MAG: TonB-dependent receptor plug domain-containing protein [Nitrospiria bacterium]
MCEVCGATGLFFALLMGFSGNIFAEEITEEEPMLLDPIVVTATRLPSPVPEVGSSITIIKGRDLEKKHIKSVPEALREVAGVDVAQSGGLGQQTSVFLRGGESNHTLVLIDGVKVNSPTTGAFDFGDLLVENIARIEVLRGPQSSLYGSEAIGGVINIITKQGKGKASISLLTEFGSFETFRQRLGVSGSENDFDYTFSISRLESEGISAASEQQGNSEEDGYKNLTVSHRVGLNFLKDGRADFTVRYMTGEDEIDASGGSGGDDLNQTIERDAIYTSLVLKKPVTDWWTPSLLFSIADENIETNEPDDPADTFNNSLTEINVQDLLFLNAFSLLKENTLVLGLEYDQKQGASSSGDFDKEVDIKSVFIEDQAALRDALFLTVGVRYDDHSTFGDKTTFRVTSAYLIDGYGMTLHASYGTGFTAPSFNDLFFAGFSNKDLQAEESEGFDIGVRKEYPSSGERPTSWFDVTYFKNDFDELIGFSGFQPFNINKAEASGVEFTSGIGIVKGLVINLSYTYMDSEDKSTGDPLLRRAKHKGAFGMAYDATSRLNLNLLATVVEDRIDIGDVKMDDYVKVDFASSYRATDQLEGFARIENLFDQTYEEIVGFGTAGFSAYGGVTLTF